MWGFEWLLLNLLNARGAPPPPPGETAHWTGAIHVFVRDAQQRQWSRQAFIKAAVPVADEAFGFRVALSHDGDRALVAASTRNSIG